MGQCTGDSSFDFICRASIYYNVKNYFAELFPPLYYLKNNDVKNSLDIPYFSKEEFCMYFCHD